MDYSPFLRKIGLSEGESRVYLDLLEHGSSGIAEIARRTGYHRQMIYRILPTLTESGLVSIGPVGKRRVYTAESPSHLKSMVDRLKGDFESILPSLENLHISHTDRPVLKFFSGTKGVSFIHDDVVRTLKKGDIYYRYSSRKVSRDTSRNYFSESTRKMRDEKQLERMLITSEELSKTKRPLLEREVVTIPKGFDLFEDNISKVIYGSKVAVIDYNTETAFIIESAIFANFERKIFELLFRFLRKK